MSRETVGKDYYLSKGGQIPIRWTAPECLEEHKFSEQSDVWSFGILLFELWTKAATPYAGWRNEKVWVQVLGGYRLPSPAKCPIDIYQIMSECWKEPGERPGFAAILQNLENILSFSGNKIVSASDTSVFAGSNNRNKYQESTLTHMTTDDEHSRPALQYAIPDQEVSVSHLQYMVPDNEIKAKATLHYMEPDDNGFGFKEEGLESRIHPIDNSGYIDTMVGIPGSSANYIQIVNDQTAAELV